MPPKNPEAIISELTNNPSLYDEMAAREGEVWGEIFSNDKSIRVRQEDESASRDLRVARDKLQLPAVLRRFGLQPKRGLSLACGSGRAERGALAKGICTSFHGIDVAEDAILEARRTAAEENLDITYEQGDLNTLTLEPNSYDLVITSNCLHHVLQLEHLAGEIHRSLAPGGVLWIDDYIGETQFQYSNERVEIANAVLKILPPKLRTNRLNQKILERVHRPTPGNLVSPFEAIRSGEIMPIFLERFNVLAMHESNAIMRLVIPQGAKIDYLENEDTKSLFELLYYLDQLLIQRRVLEPAAIQCLFAPK